MTNVNSNEAIVADVLKRRGFEVYSRGWPDFLCVKKGWDQQTRTRTDDFVGLMAVEVKAGNDRLSDAQATIHRALRSVGVPVYVLRPEHVSTLKRRELTHLTFTTTNELRDATKRLGELEIRHNQIARECRDLRASITTGTALLEPSLCLVSENPNFPPPLAAALA